MRRRGSLGLLALAAAIAACVAFPAIAFTQTATLLRGGRVGVVVAPATVQYSDYVMLRAQVAPPGLAGSVKFTVDGTTDGLVGAARYNQRTGAATQRYRALVQPGEYEIDATFTGADHLTTASGEATLTVRPEDVRVVFVSGSRPAPWLIPVTGSGKSAPFSIAMKLIEVPDGTPGDLRKAEALSLEYPLSLSGPLPPVAISGPVWDHPDGLAPGVVFLMGLVQGYYTGYNNHPYAVYDPQAGMSAGGGTLVNPTNGRPGAFTFVAAPQAAGPPLGLFIYQDTEFTDGIVTTLYGRSDQLSSFTYLGVNQAQFTDVGGDLVTVTAKSRAVPRSADTVGIDFGSAVETDFDFADFDPVRLLCGSVDLSETPQESAPGLKTGPALRQPAESQHAAGLGPQSRTIALK